MSEVSDMNQVSKRQVGIIGCGNIFDAYARGLARSEATTLVACADVDPLRSKLAAEKYGLRDLDVDALLADPEIEIVVNLTPPQFHAAVSTAVLSAGKHVYTEKPVSVTFAEAQAVVDQAHRAGLSFGSAPDTFLGAAGQTARAYIDSGDLGEVVGATAFVTHSQAELWHPDPTFLFQPGGGPSLDMGPYYVAALVNLLGPVTSVFSASRIGAVTRPVSTPGRLVDSIEVAIPTHSSAVLTFASGALGTVMMSFDVWDSNLPHIEIYGTNGTLSVPDPDKYDDPVLVRMHAEPEWRTLPPVITPLTAGVSPDDLPLRGPGVDDLARALDGAPQRCGAELALHALEVLETIALGDGTPHEMTSTSARPAPVDFDTPRMDTP
jgi:predicted dehydrogenase